MRRNQTTEVVIKGLKVEVYNGNFEKALRQFKKKVQNSGKLQEVKDRETYEKPSSVKQKKKNAAKRRLQTRLRSEKAFRRLY